MKMSEELNKKLEDIISNMDDVTPGERLSLFENSVEKIVNDFRDNLNNKGMEKLNKKFSNKNPIPCECGKTLYYKEESKKN